MSQTMVKAAAVTSFEPRAVSKEVAAFFADAAWCDLVVRAIREAGRNASETTLGGGRSLVDLYAEASEDNKTNSILHAAIISQMIAHGAAISGKTLPPVLNAQGHPTGRPDLALRRAGSVIFNLPGEIKTTCRLAGGFSANNVYKGSRQLLIGTDFVKDDRPASSRPTPRLDRRIVPWSIRLGWIGAADFSQGGDIRRLQAAAYASMLPIWLAPAADLPISLIPDFAEVGITNAGLSPTAPVSALPVAAMPRCLQKSLRANGGVVTYAHILGNLAGISLPTGLLAASTYDRRQVSRALSLAGR
jgi:hypothetical protein